MIPYTLSYLHGDMPCNLPCGNLMCAYNDFGRCKDNCICEDAEKTRGESGKVEELGTTPTLPHSLTPSLPH